jgi:hypothetical protein
VSDTRWAQQGQLVAVAHDLKPLATPKGGGLLGHFTTWVPAWDAHSLLPLGRDPNEWVRPPLYRWTTPEREERYAPVLTLGSMRIERVCLVAALRAMQGLAKQDPAA